MRLGTWMIPKLLTRRRNIRDVLTSFTESMMKLNGTGSAVAAIAIAVALGGCAGWQNVDPTQGAMAGAAGGALAGALVGGPIGAVIGGIGGAFVGHETTGYPTETTTQG